jgi:adenylate cyclase 10
MYKQSDGGRVSKFTKNVKKTWQKRWCVLTSKDLKYYYSRAHALNAPLSYLGLIELSKIYKLKMLNEKKDEKPIKNMITFILKMGNDSK